MWAADMAGGVTLFGGYCASHGLPRAEAIQHGFLVSGPFINPNVAQSQIKKSN